MKSGDLVRDSGLYSLPSYSYYERYDYYDEEEYDINTMEPQQPPSVFIKWHIVDGEEEGEYYSCAKVLHPDGKVGNILRRNIILVSKGK